MNDFYRDAFSKSGFTCRLNDDCVLDGERYQLIFDTTRANTNVWDKKIRDWHEAELYLDVYEEEEEEQDLTRLASRCAEQMAEHVADSETERKDFKLFADATRKLTTLLNKKSAVADLTSESVIDRICA